MSRSLGRARWPEVSTGSVLAVPIGATEQHGPHLPLNTDTAIAAEICRRLAERVPGVLVAPAVAYGSSGEHAGYPGTLSIGQRALELLLVELVRSADGFRGTVVVSGHGGNAEPLRAAVHRLRYEGRNVLAWTPTGLPEDSHAGFTETSVMLHLSPEDVDLDRAESGNTTPLPELLSHLRSGGVRAVSHNGVLGDPVGANPADGERILDAWTEDLIGSLDRAGMTAR